MGMFQEELIKTLQNVCYKYVERKEEKYLIKEERVRLIRGTITSVAHYFEDEMGRMLYRILGSKYRILVDYPIMFPGRNNRFTPDILIIEDKTIVMILELKIDLGYVQKNWRDKKEKIISRINLYKNDMYYKELNNGEKESTKINIIENVPYGTIILSQKNGGKNSQIIIDECENSKCILGEKVPFFHLLRDKKKHPNDFTTNAQVNNYFEDLVNNYLDEQIQYEVTKDWIRLEKFLKQHLEL